jgi:hypothetical protein
LAKQESAQQQQLFAQSQPQTRYGWKSITKIQRGEIIVVMEQEVKILGLKEDNDSWTVSYTDPTTGKKTEQIYNAIDSVYAKL